MYKEIEGDLIKLAQEGRFDVIAHGCNCFCTMGAGIAPLMAKAFGCDKYGLENPAFRGNVNKLGQIESREFIIPIEKKGYPYAHYTVNVINAYTQYNFTRGGIPLDYEALTLCMRKINSLFTGQRIGLPQIGCGLAGGDWNIVKEIIKNELVDCDVTIVIFKNGI